MTLVIEKKQEKGGYLYTHDAIRRDLTRYETLAYKLSNNGPAESNILLEWFKFLWGIIEHHHVNEDDFAFLWILEKDPSRKQSFTVLTEDHHEMDRLVEEIQELLAKVQQVNNSQEKIVYYRKFQETVSTLKIKMFDHLEREEALYLAAQAELFTHEEIVEQEKFLMKKMSFKLLASFAPWMFDSVPKQEMQKFLKNTPLILRILYRFSWKPKYDKMMAKFSI